MCVRIEELKCALVLNISKVGVNAIYESLASQIRYQSDPFSSFGNWNNATFDLISIFKKKLHRRTDANKNKVPIFFIQLLNLFSRKNLQDSHTRAVKDPVRKK